VCSSDLKLSARDPAPGEPVAALGHGGIGLLWAIKDGEVASVGKLSTHLASLVGTDCVGESQAETSAACRAAGASVELERKRLDEKVPALVVQSSCTISPGDSGGPLINLAGDVVGVNAFLKTDARAAVSTNFHVHVAEVRRFLEAVPTTPETRLPSPWDLLLAGGTWADTDGDGKDDLYRSGTGPRAAFLVNASQAPVPPPFLTKLRPDAVLAQVGGQWLGWFDRDGDGVFDRVVLDGAPGKAWEFDGLRPGRFLGAASVLDPGLLSSPRWQQQASELQAVVSRAPPRPPDPLLGLKGFAPRDLDGDGRVELITARRGACSAVFVDAIGEGFVGDLESAVRAKPPALRIVRQLDRWWIFVGETRVLETVDLRTVERAFLSGAGGLVEAPELVGADWQGVVASSFVGRSRERVLLALEVIAPRSAAPSRLFPIFAAPRGKVSALSGPGLPLSIVTTTEATERTTIALALDGRDEPVERRTAWASQGFPGAAFLWSSNGTKEWFQYDTDADGEIDVVLVRTGGVTDARRIAKDGAVTLAPELAVGAPVRPALLKDPARAQRLRTLALETFAPDQVSP
jgi:hypothetical protein